MTKKEAMKFLEYRLGKRTLARAAYNYARFLQGELPPEERDVFSAVRDIIETSKESRE